MLGEFVNFSAAFDAGAFNAGPGAPAAQVQGAGRLSGMRGVLRGQAAVVATARGPLSGLRGVGALAYDNRVTRYLDQRAASSHQVARPGEQLQASAWGVSAPSAQEARPRWQTAAGGAAAVRAVSGTSLAHQDAAGSRWKTAAGHSQGATASNQAGVAQGVTRAARHQAGDSRAAQRAVPLQTGLAKVLRLAGSWQWASAKTRALAAPMGASLHLRGVQTSARWQTAGAPRNGKSAWPPVGPAGPVIYPRDTHLVFECPPLLGSPARLVFGARACDLPPLNPGAVAVPIRRTYVTINSIALRRVEGDVAIPTYAFQMSLDADSWTWSWSASVPADALALVQPGSSGEPVEVEAMVNGVPYRLYAEGIASQRQFGQARISVKGRGKAALLDAPYAPTLNFGNTAPRTARQLMTDVLTVNGVGIGWAVDWQLTDWLVPGNVWTAQGAYIAAINQIAQAGGGYVQPHATEQALRILPRYPAAPWAWGAVAPDFELPAAVVAVESIDWTRKAAYDRVFVSGTKSGVLGQVTRAGTSGASVAPMVTDALITHADAARQRGLAVLSDTGQQARVTLTLPVLSETGLIQPGQFVRYLDGSESRLGLVRSTALAWSRPKLRQTIAVETHV